MTEVEIHFWPDMRKLRSFQPMPYFISVKDVRKGHIRVASFSPKSREEDNGAAFLEAILSTLAELVEDDRWAEDRARSGQEGA